MTERWKGSEEALELYRRATLIARDLGNRRSEAVYTINRAVNEILLGRAA